MSSVPSPSPAFAQDAPQATEGGILDSVRVLVDLATNSEIPTVRIRHHLSPEEGSSGVEFFVLDLGREQIWGVEAHLRGRSVPVELVPAARGLLEGRVEFDPEDNADSQVLELTYSVDGAYLHRASGRMYRVPLILPRWPPQDSPPDFLVAEALIPSGSSVSEAFPTVRPVVASTDEHTQVTLSLQTATSMLRYRVDPGDPRLWTTARLVDAFVLLVLLAIGVVGWRVLRRDLREESVPEGEA